MYKFEEVRAEYKFVLTTIQETGEKEIFIKHMDFYAKKENENDYLFTMGCPTKATIDGEPLAGSQAIEFMFDQAMYPMQLMASPEGSLRYVNDFDGLCKQWENNANKIISDYENDAVVTLMAHKNSFAFRDEIYHYNLIWYNQFYRLLFWNKTKASAAVFLNNWPGPDNHVNFYFSDSVTTDGHDIYETEKIKTDENSGVIAGKAKLDALYSEDGLPQEVVLTSRIEVKNRGYLVYNAKVSRIS